MILVRDVVIPELWFLGAQFATPILFRMTNFTLRLALGSNPLRGQSLYVPSVISYATFFREGTLSTVINFPRSKYSLMTEGEKPIQQPRT